MLENDSLLKPKHSDLGAKKNKLGQTTHGINKNEMTSNDYHEKCKDLNQELITYKEKCANL